ncbi:MAG: hypothetical protein CMJ49_14075 [Planctomycetaceae bacterium]|nr:hypothetical protein [Planctomycetaceae bacterium]
MDTDKPSSLQQLVRDTKYPFDAFHFVRRGLDFTVHQIHENPEDLDEGERHVDGAQLCLGLRDFAVEQYGQLARTVLRRWRINRTEDFGRIVFAMVNGGLMQAQEEDSEHDFDRVFDFDREFDIAIPIDQVPTDASEVGTIEQD